ncbi:MAG: hypothetical protein WCS78_04295, partial [Bacilli bacterium]
MKKTLLLIALILGVSCIFGCDGCKKVPEIEDDPEQILAEGKETYLTVKQGEYSYNITVDEMYINLRNEIGFSTVLDWADTTIVQNFSKRDLYKKMSTTQEEFLEMDDTPYWNLITDEAIINDMIDSYFGGNTSGYTSEQIMTILQENYLEETYAHGFRTFEDLKEYHHLKLAKYRCVADYYQILREADPYTEGQKKTFYNENYLTNFWGIIIPFNSYLEAENTLRELGYSIHSKDVDNPEDYSKWVNIATGNEATATEIIRIMIELYNETMVKKSDAQTVVQITEGKDYSLVNGEYVFSMEDQDSLLYHLGDNVKASNSALYTYMNSLSSLGEDDAVNANWYTPKVQILNETNYLILNIKKEAPVVYETIKDRIVYEMIARDLTEDDVNQYMAFIRWLNNLVIYDGNIR